MLDLRIREARLARGLSQAQLAEGKFSRSYIGAIERGVTKPSTENLMIIAERLGKPLAYFIPDERDTLATKLEVKINQAKALIEVSEFTQAQVLFEECRCMYDQGLHHKGVVFIFKAFSMLAMLFTVYAFFPASLGFLVSELRFFERKRFFAFITITVFLLSVEIGYLYYLQANPTIDYSNAFVTAEEASAIVAAAREHKVTIERFGTFKLRQYVFVTNYTIIRESATATYGTLVIDAFPIGHNRVNINFSNPTYFR